MNEAVKHWGEAERSSHSETLLKDNDIMFNLISAGGGAHRSQCKFVGGAYNARSFVAGMGFWICLAYFFQILTFSLRAEEISNVEVYWTDPFMSTAVRQSSSDIKRLVDEEIVPCYKMQFDRGMLLKKINDVFGKYKWMAKDCTANSGIDVRVVFKFYTKDGILLQLVASTPNQFRWEGHAGPVLSYNDVKNIFEVLPKLIYDVTFDPMGSENKVY